MQADKASVIAFLRRCSGGELSDVMRQVLPERPEAVCEPGEAEYRLFLGLAVRESIATGPEQVRWTPWRLTAIGYMDPSHGYAVDFEGEPFHQEGQCGACGTNLWSHVKAALCPICGGSVGLT
jgi:hypothetical protein